MLEPDRSFAGADAMAASIGLSWGGGDFSATAQNMRKFAGEIAELSVISLEHAKRLIEDVRDAHGMDDLMIIQAKYINALFETFSERSQRLGSFLAEMPREAAQASCDMIEAGVEAAQDAAEITANGIAAATALSQQGARKSG